MGDWIAHSVCFDVPHRQFVFTMPRPLRGIFRKRRKLLDHLFHVAIESLRDWMRARLDLPAGRLAAVAAVQTFGDYLTFHPHLHVLAATGLFDGDHRFHLMPVETVEPLAELFRHRFLETLRREKLISEKKLRHLLGWKHSGFNLDAGDKPVAANNVEGRRCLAEYLLRAPFSLEKITWNQSTCCVIYRSSRSWRTKRNFQIFTATDFLAAALEHIPPKHQQTVRYYGLYSNKHRGMDRIHQFGPDSNGSAHPPPPTTVPPPPASSARALRPLWRDLILRVWGEDPLLCPCCKSLMIVAGRLLRPEEIEFFLRLHGLRLSICHHRLSRPTTSKPWKRSDRRQSPDTAASHESETAPKQQTNGKHPSARSMRNGFWFSTPSKRQATSSPSFRSPRNTLRPGIRRDPAWRRTRCASRTGKSPRKRATGVHRGHWGILRSWRLDKIGSKRSNPREKSRKSPR